MKQGKTTLMWLIEVERGKPFEELKIPAVNIRWGMAIFHGTLKPMSEEPMETYGRRYAAIASMLVPNIRCAVLGEVRQTLLRDLSRLVWHQDPGTGGG